MISNSLLEKIREDLKDSIFKKKLIKISTLKLLLSVVQNKEIELRSQKKELSEEMVIEILRREIKKRKEAIELFVKGNRDDLAKKEGEELKILTNYLPPELSTEEIRKIIREKIAFLSGELNIGKIIGEVMKEVKGKADGKLVSDLVKEEINR